MQTRLTSLLGCALVLGPLSSCSSPTETDSSDGRDGGGAVMRADAAVRLDGMVPSRADESCTPPGDAAQAESDEGCASGRAILSGAVVNARDLGGTAVEAGQRVAHGALFRGPPLSALAPAGCEAFAALQVRTVIDLRVSSERELKPNASCVGERASLVSAPLPVPYSVSAADYIADLDATESIAEAFRVLGDEAAYPIYFHCTWGRDRTGILAALILLALGATHADILAEYSLSEPTVGAFPESLVALLYEVERRGGIDEYFRAAGIPEAAIETLRAQATSR